MNRMKGEKFILTFAIDDYKGNPWKPLDNARSDALRFKKVLIEKYGYKDYQADLFNDAATKNAIVEVLYNLSGEILEEDTIIIYFAGHGYKNNNGKGFWIPADYGTHAVTYVPNTTILQAIDDINAKHILLISDSCYFGTFINQFLSGNGN